MLSVDDATPIEDVVAHVIKALKVPDPSGEAYTYCVNKLQENLILNIGLLKRIRKESLHRLNLPMVMEQELEDLLSAVGLPDRVFFKTSKTDEVQPFPNSLLLGPRKQNLPVLAQKLRVV